MISKQFIYPGDPPGLLFLMFGEEFKRSVRFGKPGYIRTEIEGGEAKSFEIHEIRCDFCGAEVADDQPLAFLSDPGRVYCWPCHENLNGPYLVRNGK